MSKQKISGWLVNTGTVATAVATATLVTGILAPQASAINLVPDQEGQVPMTNSGCIAGNPCVTLHPLIESITSLIDTSSGEESLLFVDKLSTENTYDPGIVFDKPDAGTNPKGHWYRPVLLSEENGQLEVGTYKFEFAKTLDWLKVDFFDVETLNTTGVLKVNGVDINEFIDDPDDIGESSLNRMKFMDVDSIVLKLGEDFDNNTGDGVDFRLRTVPEPTMAIALGAVAAMGLLGLRQRKHEQV